MASKEGWTAHDVPSQAGKSIVITGASSGIGLETARLLARSGADVILAVRNAGRGQAAIDDIRSTDPDASVDAAPLDLADLGSVRGFAEWMDEHDRPVHTLINNAGIMGTPRGVTVDGFELQFGTNHLGHFALTGLLLDRLLANDDPRIVTVSSLAHASAKIDFSDLQSTKRYGRQKAYGASKLANLLFTMELQRRLRWIDRGDALSVAAHPGLAETNIISNVTGGIYERLGGTLEKVASKAAQSSADGALPTVRAATDPKAKGGDYFGPSGFAELKGPAVLVKAKPKAFDVHEARGLWEASVDLTGVDYARLTRESA